MSGVGLGPTVKDITNRRAFAKENLSKYERQRTYRDHSVVLVMPTRGLVRYEVWRAWDQMIFPMNEDRIKIDACGMEVAEAYNFLFEQAMELRNRHDRPFPFILTYEEDNVPDRNCIVDLLTAMEDCIDCGEQVDEWTRVCSNGHRGLDGISGLYFTKTDPPVPMAYGDPKNGPDDYRPQSVEKRIDNGEIFEVNGIAMGLSLYHRKIFEEMGGPWFRTIAGGTDDDLSAATQDLYFCQKAKKEHGARFAVHAGCKVGHITRDGVVF